MANAGNDGAPLGHQPGPDISPRYLMDRSKALIINNTFSSLGPLERKGSNADCNAMEILLRSLRFDVQIEVDKTAAEMTALVDKVAKETDFTNVTCFALVILSYGAPNYVYGLDIRMEVDKLVQPFKGDKCQGLVGKPKLFFLQTCPAPSDAAQAHGEDEDAKIPIEADILTVQSFIPGKRTWSTDPTKPSLFIEKLVNVMNIDELDLTTMMTRLKRTLYEALDGETDCDKVLKDSSMLRKALYFIKE